MLIKIGVEPDTRSEILVTAGEFEAKIVDDSDNTVIFQVAADSHELDACIKLMQKFNILEICRTGCVSLEKGSTTIREMFNQ